MVPNASLATRIILFACALQVGTQAAVGSETVTFSYDALGRLVGSASSGSVNNGVQGTIAYDPAGNRTNYTVTGAGGGSSFTCQYSVNDVTVSAGQTAVFTVSRAGTGCEANSEVYWYTQNGTAVAGTHFHGASGVVEFPNTGTVSKTFSVGTIGGSTSVQRQFQVRIEYVGAYPHEGVVDDTGIGTINP